MRLTPLDIKKQEFERAFRGYDPEEVRAYLDVVSTQWGQAQDEVRRLQERVRDLEHKLEHYEQVEEALQEALTTAKASSEERLENAKRRASVIVGEARSRARQLRADAHDERNKLLREVEGLHQQRGEVAARLRAFLQAQLELVQRYDESINELDQEPLPDDPPEPRVVERAEAGPGGTEAPPPEPVPTTRGEEEHEPEPDEQEDEAEAAPPHEEPEVRPAQPLRIRRFHDSNDRKEEPARRQPQRTAREEDDDDAGAELEKIRRILRELE